MIIKAILLFLLLLVFDFFALRSFLKLIHKPQKRKIFIRNYIIFSIIIIALIILYYTYNQYRELPDHVQFRNFFNITAVLVLILVPKIIIGIFGLTDDLLLIIKQLITKLLYKKWPNKRLTFFRKILLFSGFTLALYVFIITIYGIVWGKDEIEINYIEIKSSRIPQSFNGKRIAHISDLHLGSFSNTNLVEKGIALLKKENADIIVFTGDMVNNESAEFTPYIDLFKNLSPTYGMFSILGNHDMGDYRRWYNDKEKNCNLNELINLQRKAGFRMLRNAHEYVVIDNDSIAIAGVDNWGKPPFKQYGDLTRALEKLPEHLYTVLLSHDPSHWPHEIRECTRVDLTLSGHTHGAQFVIGFGKYKFSPVQLLYEHWMGLYNYKDQYLYVNTGFGYIGFPGRIGVKPEITIFTLKYIGAAS